MTPGRHVLTISAAPEGMVLDGAMYAGSRRLAPLVSDETWTVTRFAPTTVIELEPITALSYTGKAVQGKCSAAMGALAASEWSATEDTLMLVRFEGRAKAFRRKYDELAWKLGLLCRSGVYFVGDQARSWGAASRLDPALLQSAGQLQDKLPDLNEQIDKFAVKVVEVKLISQLPQEQLAAIARNLAELERGLANLNVEAEKADTSRAASLLKAVDQDDNNTITCPLNESRYDRLGWLPMAELTDSDIARWGVRVNPAAKAGEVSAEDAWQFLTDEENAGVSRQFWRREVNGDLPWQNVQLPFDWAKGSDEELRKYKGAAWYKGSIVLPCDWTGQEVTLTLTVGGEEQLWLNGREITDRGTGQRKRRYALASEDVICGGQNSLVVRVESKSPARGLLGKVFATCVALEGQSSQDSPAVDVLATPLSPCIILRPRTGQLHIHHAGKAALGLPGRDEVVTTQNYNAEADGQLGANWVLMWLTPSTKTDVRRPILLIFERNPESIVAEQGVTKIRLHAGEQVVAVRPWARQQPGGAIGLNELKDRIEFWSRAARAVPINYATRTRVIRSSIVDSRPDEQANRAAARLEQTVVYDYLETADAWHTVPLKIAPLPALCAYAVASKYPGLHVDSGDAIETLQDGGLAGAYYGIRGASFVRYSYLIDDRPRRLGFNVTMGDNPAGAAAIRRLADIVSDMGGNSLRVVQKEPQKADLSALADACRDGGVCFSTAARLGDSDANSTSQLLNLSAHFAQAAAQMAARPFAEVEYDLVDDPSSYSPRQWGLAALMMAAQIRAHDANHFITIESPNRWEQEEGVDPIQPMNDPCMLYGFSDDGRWLSDACDRWPAPQAARDMGAICRRWWPAITYCLRHGVTLHCTHFGSFGPPAADGPAQQSLMEDYLRLFEQFEVHAHYEAASSALELQADDSLHPARLVYTLSKHAGESPLAQSLSGARAGQK